MIFSFHVAVAQRFLLERVGLSIKVNRQGGTQREGAGGSVGGYQGEAQSSRVQGAPSRGVTPTFRAHLFFFCLFLFLFPL